VPGTTPDDAVFTSPLRVKGLGELGVAGREIGQ
jgi:hypothetical protein